MRRNISLGKDEGHVFDVLSSFLQYRRHERIQPKCCYVESITGKNDTDLTEI